MNTAWKKTSMVVAVGLTLFAVGCGSDETGSSGSSGTTGGDSCAAASGTYVPFDAANYESQIARVGAYTKIKALRQSETFSAADFGDLSATDPAENTMASLYVETASLAEKVAGREDDHSYKLGGPALGVVLDAQIRDAITKGAAAGAVPREEVGSIDFYGQIVDKTLQHFFYSSVFHELIAGEAGTWDEGFGYYGRGASGSPSDGISSTVAGRDDNCGLTLNDEIHERLIEGKCELKSALDAAGAEQVDVASVPGVMAAIEAVDAALLKAFAISCAREFKELPGSGEEAILHAEGRAFFGIIEPYMITLDATAAAFVRAEVDKADALSVDAPGIVTKITETFGIVDVLAACD